MSAPNGGSTPQGAPSRLELVNALAWILERAGELRVSGHDPGQALDRALQDHDALVVALEGRASAGVYNGARVAWAAVADENDAHVMGWILARADDLRRDGRARHDAIEHAIAECQEAWARATRLRVEETHQAARGAWAMAGEGDPRQGAAAIVTALDGILERALGLHARGHDPAEALARALNERGASHTLASLALMVWTLEVGGGEASA